jgi:hypothetical protein
VVKRMIEYEKRSKDREANICVELIFEYTPEMKRW